MTDIMADRYGQMRNPSVPDVSRSLRKYGTTLPRVTRSRRLRMAEVADTWVMTDQGHDLPVLIIDGAQFFDFDRIYLEVFTYPDF